LAFRVRNYHGEVGCFEGHATSFSDRQHQGPSEHISFVHFAVLCPSTGEVVLQGPWQVDCWVSGLETAMAKLVVRRPRGFIAILSGPEHLVVVVSTARLKLLKVSTARLKLLLKVSTARLKLLKVSTARLKLLKVSTARLKLLKVSTNGLALQIFPARVNQIFNRQPGASKTQRSRRHII